MKTTHQLAQELLALPDIPVIKYYNDEDRGLEGYEDVEFDVKNVMLDNDGEPTIWERRKASEVQMVVFKD